MKNKIRFISIYILMLLVTSIFSLWSYKVYEYLNSKQIEMNDNSYILQEIKSLNKILDELASIENDYGNQIQADITIIYWNNRFVEARAIINDIKSRNIRIPSVKISVEKIDTIANSLNNEFQILQKAETIDKISDLKSLIESDIVGIIELTSFIKNEIYETRF